eukprot:CAMPEP_0113724442 /NCGR_PEP_ID=MMETSP0038_2-20120614/39084_1 /TAXON_ID=2898 /ORGANISM="Cryptomonas paramecium" /LENGTH=2004 /DNA_ID=CAMNT_0000654349 /DNA_START=102 /DNA_END=6114 /DNA_ORIENTATION=- /assembly_acc=CAM_ASM_000170
MTNNTTSAGRSLPETLYSGCPAGQMVTQFVKPVQYEVTSSITIPATTINATTPPVTTPAPFCQNTAANRSCVSCASCPPGSYQPHNNSIAEACYPCGPGTFSSSKGSYLCQACPSRTCQNSSGATSCLACPLYDVRCGGPVCSAAVVETRSSIRIRISIPANETADIDAPLAAVVEAISSTLGVDDRRVRITLEESGGFLVVVVDIGIDEEQCGAADTGSVTQKVNEYLRASSQPSLQGADKAVVPSSGTADWQVSSELVGCAPVLSPGLKAQAIATTAIVAGVVAAKVTGSVAGAVAGSVGWSVASAGASAAGASVYQLIDAAQFMNVFGAMLDTRKPTHRGLGVTVTGGRRAASNSSREGSSSAGYVFSSAFGWANMRFDDIFKLKENSCGGMVLQPFFGIVGTFVTTLSASFVLRGGLDMVARRAFARISGEPPPTGPMPGLYPGAYEFHVIKTAHLGLCQAAGVAFSVAVNYDCPCGWLRGATRALAICWFLCIPLGLAVYVVWSLYNAVRNREIRFKRRAGQGSWTIYLRKVWSAQGSAEAFCQPRVMHAVIRTALGLAGALCIVMGLRAATAKNKVDAPVLFIIGFAVSLSALHLPWGRALVLALTNRCSGAVSRRFVQQPGGQVEAKTVFGTVSWCFLGFVGFLGKLAAFVDAATDPKNRALCTKGRWTRESDLRMFYAQYSFECMYFSLFPMVKNILIGILLTAEPTLVEPLVKVWILAVLYMVELAIYIVAAPAVDVLNGAKITVQQFLQTLIMFLAALTVSGGMTEEQGNEACIQLGLIQVALAIPEQLWGVVKSTSLRRKGTPREPDFKTTAREIEIKREVFDAGFDEKFEAAKKATEELKRILPFMRRGDVWGFINGLVTNRELITNLNMVKPGCLNPIFEEIFLCPEIHEALTDIASSLPIISRPVRILAETEWETSVDFDEGIGALFDIQDIFHELSQAMADVADLDFHAAVEALFSKCATLKALALDQEDSKTNPALVLIVDFFRAPAFAAAAREAFEEAPELEGPLGTLLEPCLDSPEAAEEFFRTVYKASVLDVRGVPWAEHVVRHLDQQHLMAVLRRFGDLLPEPTGRLFRAAVGGVWVMAAVKSVVEKICRHDFAGSLFELLSSEAVLSALDQQLPGTARGFLRRVFHADVMRTALLAAKRKYRNVDCEVDMLLSLAFEEQEDVQTMASTLNEIHSKCSVEYKFDAARFWGGLTAGDALRILRELGRELPEEAQGGFNKALDAAAFVPPVREMIRKIEAQNFQGALATLVSSRELILGLDRLLPGAINRALRSVFGSAAVEAALEEARQARPHAAGLVVRLRTCALDTTKDLAAYLDVVEELEAAFSNSAGKATEALTTAFESIFQAIDSSEVMDLLRVLGAELPEVVQGDFNKALDAVGLVPAVRALIRRIEAQDFQGALATFISSRELILGLDKLVPGAINRCLRSVFASPAIMSAFDAAQQARPQAAAFVGRLRNCAFDTPEDLEVFLEAVEDVELAFSATAGSAVVAIEAILQDVDSSVVMDVFRLLGAELPAIVQEAFNKALDAVAFVPAVRNMLRKIETHDFQGALATLISSRELIVGLDRLVPGAMNRCLRSVFGSEAIDAALEAARQARPQAAAFVSRLRACGFDSPEDLENFLALVDEFRSTPSMDELLRRVGPQDAVDVLRGLGEGLPAMVQEGLGKALDAAASMPPINVLILQLKDRDAKAALLTLFLSKEIVKRVHFQSPELVKNALRQVLEVPAVHAALESTAASTPSIAEPLRTLAARRVETQDDFVACMVAFEQLKAHPAAPPTFSIMDTLTHALDDKSARAILYELARKLPGPVGAALTHRMQQSKLAPDARSAAGGGVASGGMRPSSPDVSSSVVFVAGARKESSRGGHGSMVGLTSTPSQVRAAGQAERACGDKAMDFAWTVARVVTRLDPERVSLVVERFEDAVPEVARPLTEDGFEALYEAVEELADAADAAAAVRDLIQQASEAQRGLTQTLEDAAAGVGGVGG